MISTVEVNNDLDNFIYSSLFPAIVYAGHSFLLPFSTTHCHLLSIRISAGLNFSIILTVCPLQAASSRIFEMALFL